MKAALKALGSTIIELLDSKKFAMAVLGVICTGLAHFGLNVTPEQALVFASPFYIAILGQSHVDAKTVQSNAAIKVAAMANPGGSPEAARIASGGFIGLRVMLVLAVFAAIAIACGAAQRAAEKDAGTCIETAAIKAVENDVKTAVDNGDEQWEQLALAALTSVAPDAVICVAQLAEQLVESEVKGDNAAAIARAKKLVHDLQTNTVAVPRAPVPAK
jgi:hypothetical protein